MRSLQNVEHVRMCRAKYCAPGATPHTHTPALALALASRPPEPDLYFIFRTMPL
jgi:hypothetical protein